MSQLNKNLDMKKIYSNYTFVFSFLVLVVIATVINHSFLSWTNLSTLMLQSSIKGIIALGMTLIIISGQIDLSVGSQCALVAGLGSCSQQNREPFYNAPFLYGIWSFAWNYQWTDNK